MSKKGCHRSDVTDNIHLVFQIFFLLTMVMAHLKYQKALRWILDTHSV